MQGQLCDQAAFGRGEDGPRGVLGLAASGGFTALPGIQGAHGDVPRRPRLLREESEARELGPSLKKAAPRRTQSSLGGECGHGGSRASTGTPRGLPRGGGGDRQKGEGSSPLTLVASRRGASGFPVSSYMTLFGHWESNLVVLGSFRAFRCPSFTSSTWPGWALEVQEPMGLVSDGGGMLRPSPGGGHRRRSPPGGALEEGKCRA